MSPEVRLWTSRGVKQRVKVDATDSSLEMFFRPNGIVVIGASGDPKKLGFVLTRNLLRSGYEGSVHLVNRRGGRALSRPLFSNVGAVPDPVDLAVLVVPAAGVPAELERCADRGIPAAIVISGGFREVGPEGERLEAQCRDICDRRGIRVLGPNCIGIIDNNLPLDTTFLTPPGAPRGEVGLISQSGSLCAAAIDWSREIGFGWSQIVSLGNQVDVNETDMLEPIGSNAGTTVVALYLEGVRDGRRFVDEASKLSKRKPIVALKVGQTTVGHAAVSSHTGALAGADVVYDAAFRRCGIFRAHTTEEMFHATRALAWSPIPAGPRVAVLTNAGGPGVVAIDELDHQGLVAAEPSESTIAALKSLLPTAASLRNPVDMLASASTSDFASSLKILLDDDGIDAVITILPPPPAYPAERAVEAMLPIIQEATKPVVFALMGGARLNVAEELLEAAKIPVYRFPEPAVAALAALVQRGTFLARQNGKHVPESLLDVDALGVLVDQFEGLLLPDQAAAIAKACGIDVEPISRVRSGRAAVRLARKMGYPIVLKAAAPGITHKTEVGGVALGIPGSTALVSAIRQMRQTTEIASLSNGKTTYFLQRMGPDGQDVVVGAVRDPQFGPVVMFGTGGVEAELRGDVVFELAPLSPDDAREMIEGTQAGLLLSGFRGSPALDVDAVVDVICRVAAMMIAVPTMQEFEINPLRVHRAGAVALDARGKIDPNPDLNS